MAADGLFSTLEKGMEFQEDLKKQHRHASMIAVAIMGALLVYPIIVQVVRTQYETFSGYAYEGIARWKDIFFLLALMSLVGVRGLRANLLKGYAREADPTKLAARLTLATVFSLLLCELPAIVGLMLFLMGGFYKEFYILFACSVAAMLVYFPRYSHWEIWIRRRSRFY